MSASGIGTTFFDVIAVEKVPHIAATFRGPRWPRWFAFGLTRQSIEEALATPTIAGTLRNTLDHWRALYAGQIENAIAGPDLPDTCLQMPAFIALALAEGLWHVIAIAPTARFDTSCDLYPLRTQILARGKIVGKVPDLSSAVMNGVVQEGINPAMFQCIADKLREWSPLINAGGAACEEARERDMLLAQFVTFLDCASESANAGEVLNSRLSLNLRLGYWREDLGHFTQYKASFLVECLIFSFALRDAGTLGPSLRQAMRMMPNVWRATLSRLLSKSLPMPSAACMSRARLYVDVGYMLCRQAIHADLISTGPVCFGLVDSSPQ